MNASEHADARVGATYVCTEPAGPGPLYVRSTNTSALLRVIQHGGKQFALFLDPVKNSWKLDDLFCLCLGPECNVLALGARSLVYVTPTHLHVRVLIETGLFRYTVALGEPDMLGAKNVHVLLYEVRDRESLFVYAWNRGQPGCVLTRIGINLATYEVQTVAYHMRDPPGAPYEEFDFVKGTILQVCASDMSAYVFMQDDLRRTIALRTIVPVECPTVRPGVSSIYERPNAYVVWTDREKVTLMGTDCVKMFPDAMCANAVAILYKRGPKSWLGVWAADGSEGIHEVARVDDVADVNNYVMGCLSFSDESGAIFVTNPLADVPTKQRVADPGNGRVCFSMQNVGVTAALDAQDLGGKLALWLSEMVPLDVMVSCGTRHEEIVCVRRQVAALEAEQAVRKAQNLELSMEIGIRDAELAELRDQVRVLNGDLIIAHEALRVVKNGKKAGQRKDTSVTDAAQKLQSQLADTHAQLTKLREEQDAMYE